MAANRNDIREIILSARKAATAHADNIKNANPLTKEIAEKEIFGYLKAKFHLKDEDCTTDDFAELTEISLAKSMEISPALVEEFDLARSCDGTSSKTAKMVLFFMALQKEFNIEFEPMETVMAKTVYDIGDLVYKELTK